jgi:hypothetical protein
MEYYLLPYHLLQNLGKIAEHSRHSGPNQAFHLGRVVHRIGIDPHSGVAQ